jgi:hypothetical protein
VGFMLTLSFQYMKIIPKIKKSISYAASINYVI